MYDDSVYAMKPGFFRSWNARRENLEKDAGLVATVLEMKADDLEDQYKRVFKVDRQNREATIYVTGPLTMNGPDAFDLFLGYTGTAYPNIRRAAEEAQAMKDAGEIDSVSVIFNSPGGSLEGVEETHKALKGISDFTTGLVSGDAASAAYWLATALKRVEPMNDTASAGSIGVLVRAFEDSGYLAMFGVEEVVITNTESPNKAPDIKTDEGKEIIRKELDAYYKVFTERVTAARPITVDGINALRGEMLVADDAIKAGLLDAPHESAEENNQSKEVQSMNADPNTQPEPTGSAPAPAEPTAAAPVDEKAGAINAERERIFGLLAASGVDVPDAVSTAIQTGTGVTSFVIAQAQAKKELNKQSLEQQRLLRADNPDFQPGEMPILPQQGSQLSDDPDLVTGKKGEPAIKASDKEKLDGMIEKEVKRHRRK